VPVDAQHHFTGSLFTLLNPYPLLGGLTTLSVFALHGAVFASLKTTGELRQRARMLSLSLGGLAVVFGAAFLLWTQLAHGKGWTWIAVAAAAAALVGGVLASRQRREG